ncbi:acyl-CoA-binding protein [Hymenobacter sp. BT664]|uniref:Acyl-CoA-binding protein n=1 Tax=Hymenobacter montanus TaxID=2771359 RepID=A0A927BAB4_9BACT|nr:acyl-CoA-binding protein [Hymenobacter montanus]MBD2766442.1 acyl-CoA-binding protein [Hymenobacter montanus]
MDINQQFQAAVEQVNNLSGEAAGAHMNELYGLYKQATVGDVNMKTDEVNPNAADLADGPTGLSQGQWDSWNQFKGLPEEEAKQRYVARVAEITSSGRPGNPTNTVPTNDLTNAPAGRPNSSTDNTTLAQQPNHGPGQSTAGGLRGDITAGAPYGGEDKLKGDQERDLYSDVH